MADLRFVRFDDPSAFLEATKPFDDSFMRLGIGSLFDYISTRKAAGHKDDLSSATPPIHLLAIYQGDNLLITLTRHESDFAWMMSTPCSAADTLATPDNLVAATILLAESLLAELTDASAMDKVIGPEDAVNAFLVAWIALLRARGTRLRVMSEAMFPSRVSYVTRDLLPPLPATPVSLTITQATPDDLDALVPLYQDFQANTPWRNIVSREAALAFLERPVASRLVYFCRAPETEGGDAQAPIGYVLFGRVTPRTIAIRNVYVSPAHRRKGVAETMVRALTRYFLGVRPSGVVVDGVRDPDGPPPTGVKDEVNLNVADPGAERVYRRSGFLFPDPEGDGESGGVDPATGRKGWYRSAWRGLQPEPEPEPTLLSGPPKGECAGMLLVD